jgi:hypothetical protein
MTDHPLTVDQHDGIDGDRLKQIVIELLHKTGR